MTGEFGAVTGVRDEEMERLRADLAEARHDRPGEACADEPELLHQS